MNKISINRFVLCIIIIIALLLGAGLAFMFINPGVLGFISSDGRVLVSRDDFDRMAEMERVYGEVDELKKTIESEYYKNVKEEDLILGMKKGLLESLNDPYSVYYTDEEFGEIAASTFGEYEGVGMTLSPTEDGRIMVIYVTSDSPAKKGGVEAGEYILKVDGTAYSGDELDVAAANIRGKSGSSVTILFEGLDGQEIERTFRRAKIIMDTVDYEMLDNDIAYISIYQFYEGTVSDFKEALMAVSSARGLVVDLRDNPGGFVDVAVDVADMLMDSATLVYTEDHNGKREYYKTKNGKLFDGPVVLLVDEMTASASEILAAGMQDNKTAVIVGKTTYGKGVIQSLGQIPGGGALRLTMWQYFSPSGKQIHEKGVTPDYEVEYDIEAVDAEGKPVDTQLEKAVSVLESMM